VVGRGGSSGHGCELCDLGYAIGIGGREGFVVGCGKGTRGAKKL
jgi:hypothetical protein